MAYEISYEPDTGLGAIIAGGEKRILACLPPKEESGLPSFCASLGVPVIPRSQWRKVDLRPHFMGIDDQDGHGACGGFATEAAFHVAWNATGRPQQKFSPWFIYAQCNGGRDSGCVVSETMRSIQKTGVPLDSEVPDKAWHRSMIPAEASANASQYRAFDCYQLNTFDEIATAIQCGFPVSYGVLIGNRFDPDSRGVIPPWDGRNIGGHAMAAIGLDLVDGVWHLLTPNSWGTRWGLNGFCYIPESYFRGQRWQVDAFAVRSPMLDAQDQLIPAREVA